MCMFVCVCARGGEKFLILQPEFNGDIYARCTPPESYAGINNADKGSAQLLQWILIFSMHRA